MSLHSIIEPAGTLVTGWKLVPKPANQAADVRNDDDCPVPECDEGDRTPVAAEDVKPTQPDPRSRWEMGECG